MSIEELLSQVSDYESFVRFATALAEDREQAEKLEREDHERYQWGGARGWQNSDISAYLNAALLYFESGSDRPSGSQPTWRDLAEFLYMGKVYE